MARLFETKVDQNRVYFHGSSEARVDHLEAPSFQHPFYVTSDLHYAMAFCTKSQSSTGDYEVKKIFTPADQNYVYVVTLKPTCQVFDFRDKSSPEFKKLYNVIDKEIVDWVLSSTSDLDFDDIYEFIIGLDQELLSKIENYSTYQQYYEASHYASGKPLESIGKVIAQSVFEKAKSFALSNGIQKASELDIHEIMAPILKKLNELGFQGVLTKEHDYNDEVNWIRITPAKVTTDYAIGIFDKSGLDIVGLVPMRYKWLKKINPDYWYNSTSETASQKIKRFIQLYKRMTMKKVNESALDKKSTWYFGNNRAKNLKLAPPKWHSPFFLTMDYIYAEQYSDYGVYTITLKNEAKSKILDFGKDSDVKKLKWPKALIDDIRTGKSDLNGIAYDMYILAGHGHSQEVFDKSWYLSDAAYDFDVRSENIFDIVPKHANWAREKDHRFLLQMWKDIHDAGFDGFTHVEFGKKILALFDFKQMDKISVKPTSKTLNERLKSRALRKAFNAKGQDAFPKIKSDDDIVFVSGIPKDRALQLLKRACHDVSNFHPEYMEKAVKWSDDQIFGVFNKHDKRNVLAMASVSYNGDKSGAAYLHEMTGFIKGGYGKKLVVWLFQKFKKVYGQIALEGSGTKNDPYRPNEKLRDKFYATIPGVKIYRVENSVWNCPADFFYYGISDGSIKDFLEKTYGSKESLNEDIQNSNLDAAINDVLSAYKQKFGFDLSYMKFKVDRQPVYTNGEPCYEYDEDECAGDWTSLGWIRLNPDMKSVMDRYGVTWHGSDDIEEFTKIIIAHELAHEVWNKIADDDFKDGILDDARRSSFNTEYLDTVKPSKIDEETFCEYLAHQVVQQKKDISFPDEEVAELSNQSHIVTHRVSDDASKFNVGDVVTTPWGMPYRVSHKTMIDKAEDSPYADDLTPQQLAFLDDFDEIAVLELDAQYEPPYTLQQIKAKYPEHIYNKLANDPVHRWRAETGIELIHKEPTEEELDRIWKNWQLMPQEMKDISDKKSIELFGCTNAEQYNKLKASEDYLTENKATYLQKYRDESDVKSIVDMFWAIRNRLSAPQNDIDWWIKKPFNDLKSFVQNFDTSNKRQRRDANYKQQAIDNGAKLLDTKDGYEIWYVPTYDAMVAIGRFYKGRSAKWCVASDDPDFWFDNHDEDEFVVLVREHPQNDEFDKVAIQMMNHGRYYNEDDIIPWDLENNDFTFNRGVIDNSEELVHYAWTLFKDNGESREQYFG